MTLNKSIVKNKYPEAEKKELKYFPVTQAIFNKELSEFDVGILTVLSSYTYPNVEEKRRFETNYLNLDVIFNLIGYKTNKTSYQYRKDIEESINHLIQCNLIRLIFLSGNDLKKDTFKVIQSFTDAKERTTKYIAVPYKAFFNILSWNDKPSSKLKCLAVYLSVCFRIFGISDGKHEAIRAVNFEPISVIGKRLNMKRNATERFIIHLIEMNVLASFKVILSNTKNGEAKYYLSRYEERGYLVDAILNQLEKGYKGIYIKSVINDYGFDEELYQEQAEAEEEFKEVKVDVSSDNYNPTLDGCLQKLSDILGFDANTNYYNKHVIKVLKSIDDDYYAFQETADKCSNEIRKMLNGTISFENDMHRLNSALSIVKKKMGKVKSEIDERKVLSASILDNTPIFDDDDDNDDSFYDNYIPISQRPKSPEQIRREKSKERLSKIQSEITPEERKRKREKLFA